MLKIKQKSNWKLSHICLVIFIVVDPKMIRSVTQKPWHDPNREFCDPLHPYRRPADFM